MRKMAADNSYREEWRKIERIADQVSSLQDRLYRLEEQASQIRSQIAGLSYEPDEEGNDTNESIRDSYYSYLESIQSEIDDVNGMRAAASANARDLAAQYRQQAGQYVEKASHTIHAQSQFQALEGFRFGASTAKAGASLAGQRASHYEDHVAILNDLSDAAGQAAYGSFSGGSVRSIGDRGTFHNPGQHVSGKTENSKTDFVSDKRENKPADQMGYSDLAGVSHAGLRLDDFAVHNGVNGNMSANGADEMLAANWETTADAIREYRDENDLVWVKGQDAVELIPGSIVREHGGENVLEEESENRDSKTASEDVDDTVEDEITEESGETGDKRLPKSGGCWEGEKGNSLWNPGNDKIPGKANPDNKSWSEIKEEYGIDGVQYNDGEPDFSNISRGEAHIEDFTSDRYKNFKQADEAEAEKRGCTPEDVKQWRQENGYTWHERGDCETMDKVPSIVHNNVVHSGGISEKKKEMNLEGWL